MINRRSFAALAGAALFGLFSRIRFAPSAPRRRVRRGGLAFAAMGGGEFTFELTEDRQLSCRFKGHEMIGRQTADGRHHFTFGGHALGTAAFVTAELLESDKVGIESVEIYHRRDSDGVLAAVEYPGDEPGINEDYDLPLVFRPYHDNAIGAGEFASLDGVLGQGSFESLDWSTV